MPVNIFMLDDWKQIVLDVFSVDNIDLQYVKNINWTMQLKSCTINDISRTELSSQHSFFDCNDSYVLVIQNQTNQSNSALPFKTLIRLEQECDVSSSKSDDL